MNRSFFMVLSLALLACNAASDDDAAEPTLAERLDELDGCTPTDLQVLLTWVGPAFDPQTGTLIAPLPEGHVEAVVNGWRRYDDAAVELRMQQGAIVAGDVLMRDGLLGFEAVESEECDISISHTLWRDEAAMFAFVVGEAHANAMAHAQEMHHEAAGAHWSNPMRTAPPTWQDGIARMIVELRAEQ
jgi:hypothetical protein